jgi:hypothetical protein
MVEPHTLSGGSARDLLKIHSLFLVKFKEKDRLDYGRLPHRGSALFCESRHGVPSRSMNLSSQFHRAAPT